MKEPARSPEDQEVLERSLQLLERAPDAIVVVGERGTIRFANRQTEAIFGYKNEELVGEPLGLLLPERFRESHRHHVERYCAAPETRPMGVGLELYARRKDGSEFPVEISLSPSRIGGELFVMSAIRDSSRHCEIERRLQQALEEAESSSAAKARFIATTSHDLRQPLQAVSLYLDVATSGRLGPPEVDETLRKAKQSTDALRSLLDKVFHISKLDSGAVTPQPQTVPLATIFRQLETTFGPLAASKSLELRFVDTRAQVLTDPILFRELLENLISNALRYTHAGRILVGGRRRGAMVPVQVWDSGVGIPQEEIESVFDEFHRGAGPDLYQQDGMGLGLSIVRRLATLMGHDLGVRSWLGRGSVFEVVVERAREEPMPTKPVRRRSNAVGTVALLEDDPAVLDSLESILALTGYRVVAASTLELLLARIEATGQPPDILVSDYRLGGSATGLDAVRELQSVFGPSLGAVLLTGDSSYERLAAEGVSGGFGVLAKPVDAGTLLAELEQHAGGLVSSEAALEGPDLD